MTDIARVQRLLAVLGAKETRFDMGGLVSDSVPMTKLVFIFEDMENDYEECQKVVNDLASKGYVTIKKDKGRKYKLPDYVKVTEQGREYFEQMEATNPRK